MRTLAICGFVALASIGCGGIDDSGPTLTLFDAATLWLVQPSSAMISPNDDGQTWDIDNSAPDIVVRTSCPASGRDVSGETNEVESYTPSWSVGGCVARTDDLVENGVDFEIFDVDDGLDSDDGVAETRASIRETDLQAGTVTVGRVSDLDSMVVVLRKQ